MRSYISFRRFTPAVLEAVCRRDGLTPDQFRLGTLKRVDVELRNLIDNSLEPLHPDDRAVLEDLHEAVRLAIADD